jgi:hypothetical protein
METCRIECGLANTLHCMAAYVTDILAPQIQIAHSPKIIGMRFGEDEILRQTDHAQVWESFINKHFDLGLWCCCLSLSLSSCHQKVLVCQRRGSYSAHFKSQSIHLAGSVHAARFCGERREKLTNVALEDPLGPVCTRLHQLAPGRTRTSTRRG